MKLKGLSLITLLFLFISCEKTITPILGHVPDKLNVLGSFDNYNGLKIQVWKVTSTLKPVLFNDLIVDNAKVYLFDSISNRSWLIPYNKPINYYTDTTLQPSENNKYKIRIEVSDIVLESKWIRTPSKPDLVINSKNITFDPDNIYGGYRLSYDLKLTDRAPGINYYTCSLNQVVGVVKRPVYFPEYVESAELCGYFLDILPSICFSGQTKDIKIMGTILKNEDPEKYKGKYYSCVFTVSENYYQYTLSKKEPEPFERYFLNPPLTRTDFEGGFGFLLIKNIVVLDSIIVAK